MLRHQCEKCTQRAHMIRIKIYSAYFQRCSTCLRCPNKRHSLSHKFSTICILPISITSNDRSIWNLIQTCANKRSHVTRTRIYRNLFKIYLRDKRACMFIENPWKLGRKFTYLSPCIFLLPVLLAVSCWCTCKSVANSTLAREFLS